VSYVWNFSDWQFKQITATETVAAGGYGSLPVSFVSWGKWGGVYVTAGPPHPKWKPYSLVKRWLFNQPTRTGRPVYYTDAELDTSVSPPVRKILFFPALDQSYALTYVYEREPPHIDDSTSGGGPNSATDELNLFPRHWLENVLMEGMQDFYYREDGDARTTSEQRQRFADTLKQMKENEQPGRNAPHNIPPWGARVRGGIR